MKIKTIRQIRKCLNGNLAAYLAPLANPLGANMANGNACGPSRQNQGFQGGTTIFLFSFWQVQVQWSLKSKISLSPSPNWENGIDLSPKYFVCPYQWGSFYFFEHNIMYFNCKFYIFRGHTVSCFRPYLKGGPGIFVLFSLSLPHILHSLCDRVLFLNKREQIIFKTNNIILYTNKV